MKLELKRPLVFFDLETTGIDTTKDRIIEMGFVKLMPNGDRETKTRRVNPEMPIPAESTAVHHITDQDVKNEPTFAQLANGLKEWLGGCDLAGYNCNRFDVPVLVEEFLRCGVELEMTDVKVVDVQNIFHKMEPRTLVAAYKFYCNQDLENAHSAQADIDATVDVLLGQVEKYTELIPTVDALSEFTTMQKTLDFAGRIALDQNNTPIFNFGKHKGVSVEEVFTKKDTGYYNWMMNGDFPLNTKNIITKIKNKQQV